MKKKKFNSHNILNQLLSKTDEHGQRITVRHMFKILLRGVGLSLGTVEHKKGGEEKRELRNKRKKDHR
jgi:hypothetical protein